MNSKSIIVLKKSTSSFKVFQQYVKSSSYKCASSEGVKLIDDSYLNYTVDTSDYIILVSNKYMDRTTRSGPTPNYSKGLMGFACISVPKNKDYVYVDLICGAGTANMIFTALESLAKELKRSKIKLSAIPTAMMGYYGVYGFKFTEEDNCQELNTISAYANELNDIIKHKLKLLKSVNVFNQKEVVRKVKQLEKNEKQTMNKFQDELIKHSLTHDKNCKTRIACGVDGYSMTKCLK